jgi:hypothetical protein
LSISYSKIFSLHFVSAVTTGGYLNNIDFGGHFAAPHLKQIGGKLVYSVFDILLKNLK